MRALALRYAPFSLLLAALIPLGACDGCADDPAGESEGEGQEGEGEGQEGEGEGDEGEGEGEGDAPTYTLVIEPADPVLDATVGGNETLQLTATLVDEQGQRTPAPDTFWGSLAPQIGAVDQTGLFTPSRERAGERRARARAAGIEATTLVRVTLREVVSTGGTGTPADFTGPVAAAPLPVLYPFDGVVIPANLAPMVVQWTKQHAHARVLAQGALGALELYTDGDEVQASAESWRRFLLAHVGTSFTLTVEESEGAGAERAQRVLTVHLAAADLTSTVYYWAVDRGRIVRIDADSLDPIDLDIPAQGTDNGCRACHALSANGQRMSFTYYGGNGPGGVYDTSGNSVMLDDPARAWNFSALSPDGSLLITNMTNRMMLRDGTSGLPVPGQADIGARDTAMPAWSPTGTMLAFAGDIQAVGGGRPSWEIDFDLSNLYVADVDPLARTVTNVRQLVPGNGRCLYFPSFNPDGSLVAYTDGTHSRSTTPGDIWLARATDTSGDAPRVKLTQANPNASAYAPTFNPKVEGGYQWIAFYSRRAYGHHTAEGHPQIWVAAVDAGADPASGLDQSHPPFWLPGQAESSENLSSFFAPKPCSETGGLCDADASCCGDGLCRPVSGVAQCVPPAEACTLTGDPCGTDGECCDGLNCLVSPETGTLQCLPPGTTCSEQGQLCQLDADCCAGAGLCLDDGTGVTRCLEDRCAHVGDTCSADRPCCDAGTVCSSGQCIPIGG